MIEAVGSDSSCRHTEEAKADVTSIEIHDLSPYTNYTFKVCAMTKGGPGPAAEVKSQTPEGGEILLMHVVRLDRALILLFFSSFW